MKIEKKLITFSSGKKGVILSLDGKYFAEATPLPGFSPDKVEDFYTIREKEVLELVQIAAKSFLPKELSPSLAFAILSLHLQSHFFRKISQSPSAALLFGDESSVFSMAEKKKKASVFKVKISSFKVEKAVSIVKKIRKKYPFHLLRIDANRYLSLEEALYFVSNFTVDDFHYLEEPVHSFEELTIFDQKTSFPIALDETLKEQTVSEITTLSNLKALVIKPTLLGDIRKWVAIARSKDLEIVFSSAFEGEIAHFNIAFFSYLFSSSIPGIDTFNYNGCKHTHFNPYWKEGKIYFTHARD